MKKVASYIGDCWSADGCRILSCEIGSARKDMDPIIISIAFVLGFLCRQVGLPPMIGFLITGFVLNLLGVEGGETLQAIADVGVLLLLFSIGLKLKVKSLMRPEVWGGASIHMTISTLMFALIMFMLAQTGLSLFAPLDFKLCLLVGFALSFSSTVFAVKILEEKAELSAMHGRVAIGILIIQDLFAVLFLTFSLGKIPAAWSILIPVVLLLLRPLLFKIMERCGHGELLLLFGLFAALVVGAEGFDFGGLKPDLGALVLGVMLAGHEKSSEVAATLMGVKDLFLVGFFVTIGLTGLPDLSYFLVALLLVPLAAVKGGLFFLMLTRFNLRARSSLLAGLSLSNYSEFGLIVLYVGLSNNWIGPEWLVVVAVSLALSFIISAPLNTRGDKYYIRFKEMLTRYETDRRHPDDQPLDPGGATIGIFGMGRVGTSAYDVMYERYGELVIGFDFNQECVDRHCQEGRNVMLGDPTDPDFWSRIEKEQISSSAQALLTMPKHCANIVATQHLREAGFNGLISAIASHDDHVKELVQAGANCSFNVLNEAGIGFAQTVIEIMDPERDGQGE